MKKIVTIICSMLTIYFLSSFMLYEIKNSNPYLLQIYEEDMDYESIDYENLYQVSYGEISNIQNIETKIDDTQCFLYDINVPLDVADNYYVGQYLENCKEEIFIVDQSKKCNVRIVAIEKSEHEAKITYIYGRKILIKFYVDSEYVNKVSEKNEMNIQIENQVFDYSIKSIGEEVNNNQFIITVELDDNMALTRPGVTVKAELIVEKKDNALLVPTSCITNNETGEEYVLRYNGDDYEYCNVSTGIKEGQMVEIISGVSEGDIVVDNE